MWNDDTKSNATLQRRQHADAQHKEKFCELYPTTVITASSSTHQTPVPHRRSHSHTVRQLSPTFSTL